MDAMAQINEQIRAAREGAANMVPHGDPAPGMHPGGGYPAAGYPPAGYGAPAYQPNYGAPPMVGGYPPPAAPARPISLGEALSEGGMQVKEWLNVTNEAGFSVGKGDKLNWVPDEIEVEFRLDSVLAKRSIRYNVGSSTKFLHTVDRVTEMRSRRPWAQCIDEAQRLDPKCKGDYATADIPFVAVEDIVSTKGAQKGKVVVAKGERLGLTLSVTNWYPFRDFIKPFDDLRAAGRLPHDLLLRGKLVHKVQSGNGNTWGIATFVDFLAVADATEMAAAA